MVRTHSAKWQSIQILRAFAALAVVLFHAHWLPMGFAGVDVFFVISGFIMGAVGIRERPASFTFRRLARILPLYWLVTLAFCALSLIHGVMDHFHFTPRQLVQSLLFIPYRADDGTISPLVVQGWTLNYEMLFYLIFAACLLTPRPRLLAIGMIGLLVAGGALRQPTGPILETWTAPILIEFAAGLALSASQRHLPALLAWLALGAGLAAFALLPLFGPQDLTGWNRLAALGIPALLIVAGALGVEQAGGAGPWPPRFTGLLILLGDASYSLYLIHGLTLPACEKLLRHHPVLGVLLGVALSLVAAILCHLKLEKPLARWLLTLQPAARPTHERPDAALPATR